MPANEPHWRLPVAGIVTIVVMSIAGWSEISAKADKKEVDDLRDVDRKEIGEIRERFHELDKKLIEVKSNQEQGINQQREMNAKLDKILDVLFRQIGEGPPRNSNPNPLSNPIGK